MVCWLGGLLVLVLQINMLQGLLLGLMYRFILPVMGIGALVSVAFQLQTQTVYLLQNSHLQSNRYGPKLVFQGNHLLVGWI